MGKVNSGKADEAQIVKDLKRFDLAGTEDLPILSSRLSLCVCDSTLLLEVHTLVSFWVSWLPRSG